ncbi:hypothetical protein CSV67_09260 [Sporosarcina sp. P2]|uniref:magnesium chelatase subunit ChlI family protein n=1 Tax=Sporosarcina sp. P2 TaxID=2048251 RepID=UPI000C16E143|nr:YifB family Mg chelatase-like AAA ATPase [Sporosarcina sp. P2]PID02479.1 hypothetical protein CSV67_09260 [Sporosarcina sp. P2]
MTNYQLKLSGPILDKLDFVLSLQSSGLKEKTTSESSLDIRKRVEKARELQCSRYGNNLRNGTVSFQQLERTGGLTAEQLNRIGRVCFERKWSNRTQVKLIRIARTIADLQGTPDKSMMALEEAIEWKNPPSRLQIIGGEGVGQT